MARRNPGLAPEPTASSNGERHPDRHGGQRSSLRAAAPLLVSARLLRERPAARAIDPHEVIASALIDPTYPPLSVLAALIEARFGLNINLLDTSEGPKALALSTTLTELSLLARPEADTVLTLINHETEPHLGSDALRVAPLLYNTGHGC